jgi:hypothetical protein
MPLKWHLPKQLKWLTKPVLRKVEVFVKGPGAGRESAIRTILASGIEVTSDQRYHTNTSQRLSSTEIREEYSLLLDLNTNVQLIRIFQSILWQDIQAPQQEIARKFGEAILRT